MPSISFASLCYIILCYVLLKYNIMSYIIIPMSENNNVIYDDDINKYMNNSNFVYDHTSNIPTYPIGVFIKSENDQYKLTYNRTKHFSDSDIMKIIRNKRDNILKESDKYLMIDYKFDYKEELIIYRQYLRDLPNNVEKNISEYYNTKNKRTSLVEKFEHF